MYIIKDKETILFLKKKLWEILSDQFTINIEFVKKKRWKIALRESSLHFSRRDAVKISSFIKKQGIKKCFVVKTELRNYPPKYFSFSNSKKNLLHLSAEFINQGFVIMSENFDIIVLSTVEDFIIIGGNEEFVRSIIESKDKMAKNFLEFAQNEFWDKQKKELLLNVYRKFENFF